MKYLRKTLEFGFSATILSTLLLTACGGGGGSGAAVAANPAATGGTTVTLTPVKGKFEGNCAIMVSNTAGTMLYTGTPAINANGTTTVSLPVGTTGPYLISVAGDAAGTCKYFNDDPANPRLITMLPTESLNALVFSNQLASGVAITSLTEMAYQAASAIRGGGLSGLNDQSPEIHQGIAAAVNLAGLTGASSVLSIFTPPATIPASGVAANDDMGRTLENIARQDTARPLNAVKSMALQAAEIAAPASAVYFQTVRAALPAMTPNAQGTAYALRVATARAGAASAVVNAGNAASFLADIMSASGVRSFGSGLSTPMNSFPAFGEFNTVTLTNGVYAVVVAVKNLIGRAWTPQVPTDFVLTPRGWTPSAQQNTTFTMNPDGSAHVIQEGFGVNNMMFTKQNLAGAPFTSAVVASTQRNAPLNSTGGLDANGQLVLDASGVPTAANIVPTGAFAAGAFAYYAMGVASAVTSQDIYEVQANQVNAVNTANTGGQLAALPAAGTAFCTYNNTRYMMPSVAVAGAYDMIDLIAANGMLNVGGTCALPPAVGAQPAAGQAASSVARATAVMPTTVVVNGVTMITFSVPATAVSPAFTDVIAVVSGKPGVPNGVYLVFYRPKGTLNGSNKSWLNYSAFQQLFTALGLPLF